MIQKNMTKLMIATLVVTLALGVAVSQSSAFQAYPQTALTEKVDDLFKEWDNESSPGAALGIIKDGRLVYARGYGMANLEYNIPITPQTVFRIGSVSKQFTAMCIAILIEQGKISLDDNIRKYLPEMQEYDYPVTLTQIVHHISGIRPYTTLMGLVGYGGASSYNAKEAYAMLARQKSLLFKPGERYAYSNSAYFLLAEIVGRVSGMKTRDFARINIFEPLGMENTHFHDDVNMITKNRASGYSPLRDGGFRINMTQIDMIGDGSIYTTIEDFLKWDQNYNINKLGEGNQSLLEKVFTQGVLSDGSKNGYGFGLRLSEYRGLRTIGHGGSWAGFRANYLQFPDHRFSVVILANSSSFNPGRLVNNIADLYLADQFTGPTPQTARRQRPSQSQETSENVTLSTVQLREHIGYYYSEELDAFVAISLGDGKLKMKLGKTTDFLVPLSSDNFRWGNRKTVEFKEDQGGNTGSFVLLVGGMDIGFEKIGRD